MINKVQLIGRVGKDPDCKNLESGMKIATFSLATTETWKDKQGEKKEETTWHNIVIFGNLVSVVESYVKKGDLLFVEGKIRNRSYEKDGETKYISEVLVSDIKMLGSKGEKKEAASAPAASEIPEPSAPTTPPKGLPF